jgi:hypothetical protein
VTPVANRHDNAVANRHDNAVANARDAMGTLPTHTLGPSSTFSEPARLVLNKQLDIEKGICKALLASLRVSRSISEAIFSYSHAVEVGT